MRKMKKDAVPRYSTPLDKEKSLTSIIAESREKEMVGKNIKHKKFVECQDCEQYAGTSKGRKKIWHCQVGIKNCINK